MKRRCKVRIVVTWFSLKGSLMPWKAILKMCQEGPWLLSYLVFPLAVLRVLLSTVTVTSTVTALDVAVLIYGAYYFLGFPLLVQSI